ncbi:D-alanyl-D-alanine carboxypeptidase family protein [Paenibacillus sp. 1P07SE]|uniref:M15 family metallopeptidase n=1 Tax=Paenibacillus sp. 1P07SE TaxID=3132209 RepID=UPI0039A45B5F
MKKIVAGLALVFVLVYGALTGQQQQESPRDKEVVASDVIHIPETADHDDSPRITVDRTAVYAGELLLIDPEHPVPDNLVVKDVVNLFENQHLLEGFGILDNQVEMPQQLLERFTAMVASASADGIDQFLITSGYRDQTEQAMLYNDRGPEAAHPPGHSEHNLGLAMDIGSRLGLMKDAPEGKWLAQHAWKHGFILRYPEDKTEITGVMYEPWHYRYVGLPHSAIMQQHGFVLEEYLDFLKEQKNVVFELDGISYKVSYYAFGSEEQLEVPVMDNYMLSGDNRDGIVVTTRIGEARTETGAEQS